MQLLMPYLGNLHLQVIAWPYLSVNPCGWISLYLAISMISLPKMILLS
jgi:hypothetical protein